MHNPGTIVDSRLNDSNTDVTIVFEGAYSSFLDQQNNLTALNIDRTKKSYVIHGTPSWDASDLQGFIGAISKQSDWLFTTTLTQDYYESFGPDWNEFVANMPS